MLEEEREDTDYSKSPEVRKRKTKRERFPVVSFHCKSLTSNVGEKNEKKKLKN